MSSLPHRTTGAKSRTEDFPFQALVGILLVFKALITLVFF